MDGEPVRPGEKRITIEKSHLLVVEGRDDQLFFQALLKHLALEEIQVMEIGGKIKFKTNAVLLERSPGFWQIVRALGVVRDANDDPSGAFQSVSDALKGAGLPFPKSPLKFVPGPPRVGVMILPGDDRRGMLEDLCLEAVKDDPAMACVTVYFDCLKRNELCLPRNLSKANVQVFLASRKEAGKRLGEAAGDGYFPFDAEPFERVKGFLRQLVFEPPLR